MTTYLIGNERDQRPVCRRHLWHHPTLCTSVEVTVLIKSSWEGKDGGVEKLASVARLVMQLHVELERGLDLC